MLGITGQIHDIIDSALGLSSKDKKPLYGSEPSCLKLSEMELPGFDCLTMITDMYHAIENVKRREAKPSRENWRWKKNPTTTYKKGSEVWLERELIEQLGEDWVNQVPTSSGLINEHVDKRSAIDLVHQCEAGWYEFIELKVESNTPLFAAMEILQYGLLYIFSRTNRDAWGHTMQQNPLLYAKGVHLKVLAPEKYYQSDKNGKRYELGWVEKKLHDGLKEFLSRRNADYGMTFCFESFTSLEDSPEDLARKRTRVYAINS